MSSNALSFSEALVDPNVLSITAGSTSGRSLHSSNQSKNQLLPLQVRHEQKERRESEGKRTWHSPLHSPGPNSPKPRLLSPEQRLEDLFPTSSTGLGLCLSRERTRRGGKESVGRGGELGCFTEEGESESRTNEMYILKKGSLSDVVSAKRAMRSV